MSQYWPLAVGAVLGLVLIPILAALGKALSIEVDDEEVVLVTRFGKLWRTLSEPGLHFLPSRIFPWVRTQEVSLRRDFRQFTNVHVNDSRGTTIMIDLFLEFRVADPVKALYSVADWDRSLQNLVSHAATSILGNRDFQQILHHRLELGELLQHDISDETSRWGIAIEMAMISKISLLPEVSREIFDSVAARLERARAGIEEMGRLDVAKLEADTSVRVASLVAQAKGQYPQAVGRALESLSPEVLAAYMELHELAQVRPHRTVTFRGFGRDELSAAESAMLIPGPGAADGPLVGAHGSVLATAGSVGQHMTHLAPPSATYKSTQQPEVNVSKSSPHVDHGS